MVKPWIVKEMDRKLIVIYDVVSVHLNLVANYNITKSPKPAARLSIIQLNSLVQKQINIAKRIYDKISKYSR